MSISKNPERIKGIFSSVAHRYDLANQILSVGIHKAWKKKLVRAAGGVSHCLDLATGTGDVAFEYKKIFTDVKVTGLDFSADMLAVAREKNTSEKIDFIEGDILSMPFGDQEFEAVTFSFGMRNVADPALALKEIRRVLKPGSRACILEFGQMKEQTLWTRFFSFYQGQILPHIGGAITGDAAAYKYLDQSSKAFPSGEEFCDLMKAQGYENVTFEPFSGGIAYLYSATTPHES